MSETTEHLKENGKLKYNNMNTQLFIAEKVKVGFNKRTDTYTGKLGYVIGFDGKKWRKEPSWEGWRETSSRKILIWALLR